MARPRADEILGRLKGETGRGSTARRVIVECLLEDPDHVTVDALVARAQARAPEVHRATVYRTLEALEHLGVLYHVHLGHSASYWHLAEERHQHLVCRDCGAVQEVAITEFEAMAARLKAEFGFDADLAHFAVVGRCARCAAAFAETLPSSQGS